MLKKVLVLAGSAAMLALAAPAAHADITNGTGSVLGGNQIHAPITVPVNVCGNSIGIGVLIAGCKGGANAYAPSHH
ncbi:chaplin [Nonomuraea sp. MG754425]|uniref:chaplin family protein n=1 Tax=Nonomuraea sp. MG754425 TaxID=2570319 RepID=UPI001F227A26|nr:chaplin family protein [Nonomuraea sp. MG754425]MCF6472212.1 chaplin [Nonomuraea sp. MG754425]